MGEIGRVMPAVKKIIRLAQVVTILDYLQLTVQLPLLNDTRLP